MWRSCSRWDHRTVETPGWALPLRPANSLTALIYFSEAGTYKWGPLSEAWLFLLSLCPITAALGLFNSLRSSDFFVLSPRTCVSIAFWSKTSLFNNIKGCIVCQLKWKDIVKGNDVAEQCEYVTNNLITQQEEARRPFMSVVLDSLVSETIVSERPKQLSLCYITAFFIICAASRKIISGSFHTWQRGAWCQTLLCNKASEDLINCLSGKKACCSTRLLQENAICSHVKPSETVQHSSAHGLYSPTCLKELAKWIKSSYWKAMQGVSCSASVFAWPEALLPISRMCSLVILSIYCITAPDYSCSCYFCM